MEPMQIEEPKLTLQCYKIHPDARLPEYGTEGAACFDLHSFLPEQTAVTVYSQKNEKVIRQWDERVNGVKLYPSERMLVPTGLIFGLMPHESLRIHPRSGLALKSGITVANCEGVVDSDYVEQTFVMLMNISDEPFVLQNSMRIAQGEVYFTPPQFDFIMIDEKPEPKTDRLGGFGSTGV